MRLHRLARRTISRFGSSTIVRTPTSLFGTDCVVDCPSGILYCRKADDSPCAVGDEVEQQYNRANDTWYTTTDGPALRLTGDKYWKEVSGTNTITLNSLAQSNGDGLTIAWVGYETNVDGVPIGLTNGTTVGQGRLFFPRLSTAPPHPYHIGWSADGQFTQALDTSTAKTVILRLDGTTGASVTDGSTESEITLGGSLTGYAAQAIKLYNAGGFQFAGADFGCVIIKRNISDEEEATLRTVLDTWRT